MEFDDIGRVWRDEKTGDLRRTRTENLSTALGNAARYNVDVRRGLGRRAYWAALPLTLFFGYVALQAPNPVATTGAVLLAIFAIVVLVWFASMGRDTPDPALPVRDAIESEVLRLRALERSNRNTKWGRALLVVGYFLYTFGVALEVPDLRSRIVGMALFVLVFAIVERLSVRVIRRRLRHIHEMKQDLESWLRSLDEFALEEPAVDESWKVSE